MKKFYFKLLFVFSGLILTSKGMAQYQVNDYAETLKQPTMSSKIYLDSSSIQIFENRLFITLNGELIPISFVAVDDQGLYTSHATVYQPWHDDDWQCDNGHWNPMYETRCVVCRLSKRRDSPRWGDR